MVIQKHKFRFLFNALLFSDRCHTNQQCQLQESDITKDISFTNCPSSSQGKFTANIVVIEYSCFQGNRCKRNIIPQVEIGSLSFIHLSLSNSYI